MTETKRKPPVSPMGVTRIHDPIRRAVKLLRGIIMPIYETDYNYKHIRTPDRQIGLGKFLSFRDPFSASEAKDKFDLEHGYYCLMKMVLVNDTDKGLVKGENYIFNISIIDIKNALGIKGDLQEAGNER